MIDTHCGESIVLPGQAKACSYSGFWQGDEVCTNVIAVNGRPVFKENGEGVFIWNVPETGGDYILTLTTLKDGVAVGPTQMKTFVVPTLTAMESALGSNKMVIDTRAGKGSIETDHAEDITYSNLWSGDANATATVAVNGEVVKTATGEGVYRWSLPSKGGNYVLTHTTTKSGAQVGETLTATFVVASHEIEIDDGTGGLGGKDSRFSYSGVYDGQWHGISVAVSKPSSGYTIRYASTSAGPYVDEPPRFKDVCSQVSVYYEISADGYNTYTNWAMVTIRPKALTEAMVVADEDAAWFFDGTEKRPAVTVVDGDPNIATASDYTLAYSGRTGAGLFPVTVTGRNNYTGAVTKEFAILKRPVAPPVIPSRAYSGRLQRPTITADARWTVVANPGGTDAGLYTNVVLRLTNTADYKWKGFGEDVSDWTGVFEIRRGANGWSTYPGVRSWTNGVEAASEPTGRARFGTLKVAYRRRGAPVETETATRPSAPGTYTARFWVEETRNYAGVGLAVPYEVDFEIFRRPGDPAASETTTTPVPVPHAWLDAYVGRFGGGDYEAAAHATGANGVALWASYVAGLDPADAASRFTAKIALGADGIPVVTWSPDLRTAEPPRAYTVYGKPDLGAAAWTPVTDANRAAMRFFRVEVEIR